MTTPYEASPIKRNRATKAGVDQVGTGTAPKRQRVGRDPSRDSGPRDATPAAQ